MPPTYRHYFVTVRDPEAALALDRHCRLIRTLDPIPVIHSYCCSEPNIRMMDRAFIYRVAVLGRKTAEKSPGVIRVRAREPDHYRERVLVEHC